MKRKQLSFWLMVLIGLLASCSREKAAELWDKKNDRVSIKTACFPEVQTPYTRTVPVIEDQNLRLRCILEIYTTDAAGALVTLQKRIEEVKAGNNDAEDFVFDFEIPRGKYKCLFWADFIDATATSSEVVVGEVTCQHYEDKYYKTNNPEGLQGITLIGEHYAVNTLARDAFFGVSDLNKGTIAVEMVADALTRPFSRLTFAEKDAGCFARCTQMTAKYAVPNAFNVATAEVSGTYQVQQTLTPDGTDITVATLPCKTLFYDYVFADMSSVMGEINLSFMVEKPSEDIIIPAGIPVKRNYQTHASGFLVPEENSGSDVVKLTVAMNDEWTQTEEQNVLAPKIGDYYYADGTWSTDLQTDKTCIGVVFYVDRNPLDSSDYKQTDGISPMERVHGYVVALNDANDGKAVAWASVGKPLGVYSKGTEGFSGYKKTKVIEGWINPQFSAITFPACYYALNYQPAAPLESSGWFLPDIAQLRIMATNRNLINSSITTTAGTSVFGADNSNYWSSAESSETKAFYKNLSIAAEDNKSSLKKVRPILAF